LSRVREAAVSAKEIIVIDGVEVEFETTDDAFTAEQSEDNRRFVEFAIAERRRRDLAGEWP
jgi:hypothetical protein